MVEIWWLFQTQSTKSARLKKLGGAKSAIVKLVYWQLRTILMGLFIHYTFFCSSWYASWAWAWGAIFLTWLDILILTIWQKSRKQGIDIVETKQSEGHKVWKKEKFSLIKNLYVLEFAAWIWLTLRYCTLESGRQQNIHVRTLHAVLHDFHVV